VVAVLLRLRFRVLGNTLRRNKFQLVAVILGALQALALVAVAVGGLRIAAAAPPAAAQAILVVGGATLVFAWVVLPLLFEGVEHTLDPLMLARFPLRTGQLMAAMFLVGVTWVPGVATIAVSLGTALVWIDQPALVAVAVLSGLVGAATCIAGSRLTTTVVAGMLRGRGAARFGVGALVVLVVAAPFAASSLGGVVAGGSNLLAVFTNAVDLLSWTPLGAAWSIPGRLAMGDDTGALAAAGIALSTLGIVLALWWIALGRSLHVGGSAPSRAPVGGGLGAFAWMPPGPVGAIAARSLIYWFRDARHARQLVIIPVLPTLMLAWWWLIGADGVAIAAGPVVAALLPLSVFAGLSYDGTAFAAELAVCTTGWVAPSRC
jgi:ABC-2 type transport system permease protein